MSFFPISQGLISSLPIFSFSMLRLLLFHRFFSIFLFSAPRNGKMSDLETCEYDKAYGPNAIPAVNCSDLIHTVYDGYTKTCVTAQIIQFEDQVFWGPNFFSNFSKF
ncbi:Protein CBG26528 [Caenorhabditis briggsae]|uniref:Protein CBG26528 n=1 Tax=Caenorhabditis briggsae TaxID=6238 RepID=B6IHV9_CAEBR|nr:Protein CBG26528 [Caenorhabditis briggsae]CAR99489.1 Protein CBG26528 [Caenorhabditis briggsae]